MSIVPPARLPFPPRQWLAFACFAALALLGIVAYGSAVLGLVESLGWSGLDIGLVNRDFVNYWVAGRLVLSGEQQELFTQAIYFARLQEMFGPGYPIHNWGYPPHLLLLLWPLGFLSYKTGLVVFLGTTYAMFLYAVYCFRAHRCPESSLLILALALIPYSLMMIDTTQNGFLTASLLLLGFALKDRHPAIGGLAFGLLTIKPQLGILIPVLLLFDRDYRTIAWAAGATLLLVLASAALFGIETWQAYLTETLAYQRSVMTDWFGIFLRMMPTTFGAVRTLGFDPSVASMIQWPFSIVSAALVGWIFWRESDPLRRLFALLCGTFLISPYAFNYDMGALCVVAALLFGSSRIEHPYAAAAVAIVAVLPAAVMNLGRSGMPLSPLLLLAAMVAMAVLAGRLTSRGGQP